MIHGDAATGALLEEAARGYRTTFVAQLVRVLGKVVSVFVVARLVAPQDYGEFAMAASVFYIVVLFRDLGLGTAAAQATALSAAQLNALFWIHLALGAALTGIALALAPFAARFYETAAVAPLLAVMSLAFLLIGAGGFARAQLTREARFAQVNALENAATVFGTLAMIVTAATGGGAYAFVAYLLVSEATATALAWRALSWRPHGRPVWASVGSLWRTGADITAYQGLSLVLQQLDTVLVGRWFGAHAVGLYSRASQILALPNLHIATPLGQVTLVTLSRLTADSAQFARHAWDTVTVIGHLVLPLLAVCVVLPEETVQLLLGAQWHEAAPILRLLAVGAAATAVTSTGYALVVAAGQSRRLLLPAALAVPFTAFAAWLGARHGVIGIAAGIALVNAALAAPRLWWLFRELPGALGAYLRALRGPAVATLALTAGLLAGATCTDGQHWLVRLAAALATGLIAWAAIVRAWPLLRREARLILAYLPRPARTPSAPTSDRA